MKAITVDKVELIKKLQANRAKHREIFEEALEGYRKAIVAELERRLEAAKANKRVEHYINILQPQDQTKDYDRAIGMLEMSLDGKVELTEQDYMCYVLDDWGWKKQFFATNALYSKIAADTVAASPELSE